MYQYLHTYKNKTVIVYFNTRLQNNIFLSAEFSKQILVTI